MFGVLFIQNLGSQANHTHHFYKIVNIELYITKPSEIYQERSIRGRVYISLINRKLTYKEGTQQQRT